MKKLLVSMVLILCLVGCANASIIDDAYGFLFGTQQSAGVQDINETAGAAYTEQQPLLSNVTIDSSGIVAEINYENETQIISSDSNELVASVGDNLIIVRSRE